MSIPAPRHSKSKMITFRLTADEYDHCRQFCATRRIGSVSGMARAAIHLFLREPSPTAQTLETRVLELEGRMRHLSRELKRFSKETGGAVESPAPEPEQRARAATTTQ